MTKRRGPWLVFGACAAVVVVAMAWITAAMLDMERAQQEARADAAHQESLRLALWRMDSWLSTAIGMESTDWTDSFASGSGSERPPRTQLVKRYVRIEQYVRFGDDLSALRDCETIWTRIDRGLVRLGGTTAAEAPSDRNLSEYQQRALLNVQSQTTGPAGRGASPSDRRRSVLVPLWVRQGNADLLVYLRHNFSGFGASGFLVDWDFVRTSLTDLVKDLAPGATLRPLTDDEVERAGSGFVMASAPIAIDAPRAAATALPLVTPTRITLAVAWIAIAGSLLAVGVALKRTADLSERRSRFASSVTHELRTPLTTFRLYSEMLADGMVTDAAQRQTYLDTLKSESARLAALVENVLAYARVEEGRMPVRRERIAVADLLLRVVPPLDRRAKDAGASLRVAAGDAASRVVDADPDVVGQILFNLVDNAAKYGRSISPGREIELNGWSQGDQVRLTVSDHGPGIAPDKVRAAFTPFERAGRPPGDAIPGIGLGLALSRALARDLGGDLAYEEAPGGGASFVLTLPAG